MRVLAALFGSPDTRRLTMARLNAAASVPSSWRDFYNLLDAYVGQNGLYDWLQANNYDTGDGAQREALKSIRTPAFRIVNFYVDHLWPGDLDEAFPVETDNDAIREPMERVWEWSNWASEKDVAALQLAKYGDLFVRVTQPPDRGQVYFELVPPKLVTDFDAVRGYVKEIRLDVPVVKISRPGEPPEYITDPDWQQINDTSPTAPDALTHTEVWSKYRGDWRRWEHRQGLGADLSTLGEPTDQAPLSAFGVDFVPFVHAKFGPSEDKRGASVLVPGLDKFDELNRKATRHSQIMFRHLSRTMALERAGTDASGRPVPVPTLANHDGVVEVADETFLGIPAGWSLKQLIANLDYKAYLDTIESEEAALAQDFPEMLWVKSNSGSEQSGRAIRFLLMPAIKRVERARGNAERALIRAMMMALTVGQASGLDGFAGIGTYEDGRLAHSFAKREVLPADTLEEAQADKAAADAALVRLQLGWSKKQVQRDLGLSEEEIDAMADEEEADAEKAADKLLTALDRGAMAPGAGGGAPVPPQPPPGQNGAPAQVNGQFGRR